MKIVKLITILVLVISASLLSFDGVLAQDEDDQCSKNWYMSFSLELLPGYWTTGEHNYTFELTDSSTGTVEYPMALNVSETAPLYDGQVMLRFWGIVTSPMWTTLSEINPSQDTVFQVTWVAFDMSKKDAQDYFDSLGLAARIKWDYKDWIEMSAGPLMNGCQWESDDLFHRDWGRPYEEYGFHHTLAKHADFWSEGSHSYQFRYTDPDGTSEWPVRDFFVTEEAYLWDDEEDSMWVFLRVGGARAKDAGYITDIHPSQLTAFQVTWIIDALSKNAAEEKVQQMEIAVRWTDEYSTWSPWEQLSQSKVMKWTTIQEQISSGEIWVMQWDK
jgi:hypothetical protein